MSYTENRNGETFTLVYDYDNNGNFIGCHMERKLNTELVSYDVRKIIGVTKTGKARTVSNYTVTLRVNDRKNFLKGLKTFYKVSDGYIIRKVL